MQKSIHFEILQKHVKISAENLRSYSNRKMIYFIMSEKKFPPDPSEKADVLLSNKAINSQNMGCHMQFVFLVIPCTYTIFRVEILI